MDVALNALLLALEAWALIVRFLNSDLTMFRYYTQCSNLLAAIAAGVWLAACWGHVDSGLARRLKFCACATQTMTFAVVALVLAPMISAAGGNGYHQMFFTGVMFVTHLAGPVLTVASYLLFEADPVPTRQDAAWALLPTVAYAVVAYACNYLRIFDGPYPFLLVWNMPVWQTALWAVVLVVLAAGLVAALRLAAARLAARRAAGATGRRAARRGTGVTGRRR